MATQLTVLRMLAPAVTITLEVGETLFVLGANGTGKSALMQTFYSAHLATARRISAHRQTWIESNALTMTGAQRRGHEVKIRNTDATPEARWQEKFSHERAGMAIFDLLGAENVRARAIARAVDASDIVSAQLLSKNSAPIQVINELFRLSNLPLAVSVEEGDQVLAAKPGVAPYSIAELSDGERNALLIAASVLTFPANTLVLIDEPERHLHRSIISPLLTMLFARRPDCSFVVSTHDVMLALDHPQCRSLLLRGCTYSNKMPNTWDVDLVPSAAEIDETVRRDIYGARQKILFVEGGPTSLDKPLYSLLFPGVSIIDKEGCSSVEHAVSAIRDATDLHWLHAFGVIDNDGRTSTEIAALAARHVYALSVFTVESLYYHPEIQRRVAERHALVTGQDPAALLDAARVAALSEIAPHVDRLSQRAVERAVRDQLLRKLPGRQEMAAAAAINVTIDIPTFVRAERARLVGAIAAAELLPIFARYPVRETGALGAIATRLGFQNRRQYEGAVLKLLMDDASALTCLQALFGTLPADICGA
jgi:ABC-type cobalamin/Fe3+-siderophores transport system ATPase subunit